MNLKSSSLKRIILTTLSLILVATSTLAATIKGKIVDNTTGADMEFAYVFLRKQGQTTNFKGTITDFEGNFEITGIPAGIYDIYVTYSGYNDLVIADITLTENEVKVINQGMDDMVIDGAVVEITYDNIKDDEATVNTERKSSTQVSNPVSRGELESQGVGTLDQAASKVVGGAVEGGKYMVMRGLGDRYSITQLNGITMPSADPYRNSASLDIIPVAMIDNLNTIKTFSADQPGNFTGGKMDINTKSIPDKFYISFGLSSSFNTQTSFNSNFLSDGSRSSTDWLGFDNGLRSRPTSFDTYNEYVRNIGNANQTSVKARIDKYATEREAIIATANSLNNDYLQTTRQVPFNHGFNFAIGNAYRYGKDSIRQNKIGLNYGMNYSRNYSFYQNQQFGTYDVRSAGEALVANQVYTDTKGTDETQLGALFSSSLKIISRPFSRHQFTYTGMYNHGSENTAQAFEGFWVETAGVDFSTRTTSFIERDVINNQLRGEHRFDLLNGLLVDWTAGYTNSKQLEPDTRLFAYTYEVLDDGDTTFQLRKAAHDLPTNFFRDLADEQVAFKADFQIPLFNKDSVKHKLDYLKFGVSYQRKTREFNEYRYEMSLSGLQESSAWTSFNEADGDLASFFAPSNMGIVDTIMQGGNPRYVNGNFYSDVTRAVNSYTGTEEFKAVYGLINYGITPKVMLQAGARVETTLLETTSKDTSAENGSIDKIDLLPALNTVYNINDTVRLIFAASQTLARPNMREISPFASVGGIGAPIVLGNPDLDRTKITNADLRYERYSNDDARNIFALSAYYKHFENPIMWLLTPQASTAEIKPVNVPNARVYGFEFEMRRSLKDLSDVFGFGEKTFSKLRYGINVSYIDSRVDKDTSELNALNNTQRNLESYRQFQGQSPYIVNALLTYTNDSLKWENTLTFNMWGDRLTFVTDALTPDVIEKSRPSLDFISRKTINDHFSVSVKAKNLFNMEYRKVYEGTDNVFESYRVGRTFSVGLSYKF